jgi:hypothetical protein
MADAQEGGDVRVTTGLRKDALARIDKNDREVRSGGAGSHVSGVLLMARGIGNDELAALSGEIAISDVDGDALFTFSAKSISKLGEVDSELLLARRRHGPGDGANLVLVDVARVIEEPADKSGFAIVDTSGCAEAEQVFSFFRGKKLFDGKCLIGLQALGRFSQGCCASGTSEIEAGH